MKTLSVPDMHCVKCVANVTKALDNAKIEHGEVVLETKTVQIADVDVQKACAALDDIGFPATVQ